VSRLESPEGRARRRREPAAPRADEGLEDWFTRRLAAEGIPARRQLRVPVARVVAVGALLAALGGFTWAVSVPSADSEHTAAPGRSGGKNDGQGRKNGGAKRGDGKSAQPAISWRRVRIDVLNGYGGEDAAAAASDELRAAGWRIGATANAGTATGETIVIYAPGNRRPARVVARRLGLGAPQPIADAEGVPPTATAGIAILLGPDGLPGAA
jgi:hypothetical protein